MLPHVIQVIESSISRGSGTLDDHFMIVMQYFTLEGKFLAENDPESKEQK